MAVVDFAAHDIRVYDSLGGLETVKIVRQVCGSRLVLRGKWEKQALT